MKDSVIVFLYHLQCPVNCSVDPRDQPQDLTSATHPPRRFRSRYLFLILRPLAVVLPGLELATGFLPLPP